MGHTSTPDNKKLSQMSVEALEKLSSMFSAYDQASVRMQHSYELLKTEVVRLRGELKKKNEQLERKNRLAALGEMAAGMAHEIRNPLGAVQLYASLLERDLSHQDSQLLWARKISKAVTSLDMIVNDILAFTQNQNCDKTPGNLSELLAEVLDYVQPRVQAQSVRINIDQVDPELVIRMDVNMIRRVFLNLILNAVDAAGERGRIVLKAEACSDHSDFKIRICVIDNGPGIKPDVLNKIFNPFFTTKDSGTGLGLAIVYRLIECHGGIITAANNKTAGATFTILLP